MINSGSVNGVPAHASAALINGILRTELNWTGMAVTDWQDIEKLQFYHNVAATPSVAIQLALDAGAVSEKWRFKHCTGYITVLPCRH
jgi:beta-glucosidase